MLVRQQQTEIESCSSDNRQNMNTTNSDAYYVLENIDNYSSHPEQDKRTRFVKSVSRGSSYEDTNHSIIFSNPKEERELNRRKDSTDLEYDDTALIDGNFPDKPGISELEKSSILEGGLDSIPESIQRKLGIRIVKNDYSEYYAYKLFRRRSDSSDRRNDDSENTVSQTTMETGVTSGSDGYDKLCHYPRKLATRVHEYDLMPCIFSKNSQIENSKRYKKRSNSI